MSAMHTRLNMTRYSESRLADEGRVHDFLHDNVLVVIPAIVLLFLMLFASIKYCDLHDYRAYYLSYMSYHDMIIEPGYTLLESLFSSEGYPFYVFYGVSIASALFLFWRFIMRNARHRLLVLLLFIIYPYINILQQLRSAIAASIVLTALDYLLDDEEKPIKYCVCIAAAMMFHSTSLIYLLFLLAVRSDLDKLRRFARWSFLLVVPSISIIRSAAVHLFTILPYWAMKYTKYIPEGSGIGRAALVDWGIFTCMLLALEFAIEGARGKLGPRDKKLVSICYVVLMLALLRGVGNNAYRPALMMYSIMYVAFDRVASITEDKLSSLIAYTALILFPAVSLFVWWGPLNPAMYAIVREEMWRVWNYFYL